MGEPPGSPKTAQDGPKTALDGPKMAPRRPKMAPKVTQEWLKMAPGRPPKAPRAPKDLSKTPLTCHLGPESLKEPPDHPKMSPKVAPRWPKRLKLDAKLLPAVSLCFPRRLGDSAVHFLIPTFVQRFAHNR